VPASAQDVSGRLSKRLANYKLGDAVIKRLVDRVLIDGLEIARIDPCIYGICIDYWTRELPQLPGVDFKRGITKWEVFPYGIIDWDIFRVRVAFEVDELEGKAVQPRGFN
jgi:hypothetical protein